MKTENLKTYIPEEFIAKLKAEGIDKLYPAQEEAIKEGIFEGRSLVISTPTASGKTLTASLAIIGKVLKSGRGKAVYIVPLVALASEKYQYYKENYNQGREIFFFYNWENFKIKWIENIGKD